MGKVIEFVAASEQTQETLSELSKQPNLKFLKIFPRKGNLTRERVVESFHEAFEQIGGVNRLALWADTHPEEFFKLYARLLPPSSHPGMDGQRDFKIVHVLPPTQLDKATSLPPHQAPQITDVVEVTQENGGGNQSDPG